MVLASVPLITKSGTKLPTLNVCLVKYICFCLGLNWSRQSIATLFSCRIHYSRSFPHKTVKMNGDAINGKTSNVR